MRRWRRDRRRDRAPRPPVVRGTVVLAGAEGDADPPRATGWRAPRAICSGWVWLVRGLVTGRSRRIYRMDLTQRSARRQAALPPRQGEPDHWRKLIVSGLRPEERFASPQAAEDVFAWARDRLSGPSCPWIWKPLTNASKSSLCRSSASVAFDARSTVPVEDTISALISLAAAAERRESDTRPARSA